MIMEPRKAGRRVAATSIKPSWRSGDKVRWQHFSAIYLHDLGDGEHADIVIADRVHRICTADLRSA
jgi:hypothetical protein